LLLSVILIVPICSKTDWQIRYDTIEEFNVESKAECDQLNLAHETKTKNASAQLVQYKLKIREDRPEGIRRGKDL